MKPLLFRLTCLASALVLFTSSPLARNASAQPQLMYQITELPPAPGMLQSEALGLNDANQIVGTSYPATVGLNGVGTLWIGNAATSLGKIPKGKYSTATAINIKGRVVGDADNGDFRPKAVVFSTAAPSILTKSFNNSHAIFVADSGFIVGNAISGFDSTWTPTVWTENPSRLGQYTTVALPRFADPNRKPTDNSALGANNLGQVVGYVAGASIGVRAAYWSNTGTRALTLLPNLPGQLGGAYAYSINDSGVAVGTNDNGVSSTTPVVWAADAAHTVSALPLFPGEAHGIASSINNVGQVIGSHGDFQLPAVWINGQIHDVQSALNETGAGWVIDNLTDVNNLGFIVGNGKKNGLKRGFLLTRVAIFF